VKSPKDPSVVGLRASWTCALCKKIERSYQLVLLADPQELTLPDGWKLVKQEALTLSVCGTHFVAVPQTQEAA
jgi:hypothetical protein